MLNWQVYASIKLISLVWGSIQLGSVLKQFIAFIFIFIKSNLNKPFLFFFFTHTLQFWWWTVMVFRVPVVITIFVCMLNLIEIGS